MTTIISEHGTVESPEATVEDGGLWLDDAALEKATGWTIKPEGLCKGPVCVPVPPGEAARYRRDGATNIAAFWRRMQKPVAASDAGDVWVLGEGAEDRGQALASLDAPDFALTDLAGKTHRLSDYHGKKVLLATWASW